LLQHSESATSGELVTASLPLEWFAVTVRSRSEKMVASHLRARSIGHFLPLAIHKHRWSDRTKTVEIPVFAGYVFVHISDRSDERLQVLEIPGVLHFVGFGRTATSIPDAEIDSLRHVFANGVPFQAHEFLQIGERVRIRGGFMDGVEGKLLDRKPDTLVISVGAIQRSITVSIEGFAFERI
jgi:transcription antitermination factor NusG